MCVCMRMCRVGRCVRVSVAGGGCTDEKSFAW